jgi:hypothetical protein
MFLVLMFILALVTYCFFEFMVPPMKYWLPYYFLPPTNREKLIKLDDLLIKPEELPGQWKIEDEPYFDEDYSNIRDQEDNLKFTMINDTEEALMQHVFRYRNIPAATIRIQEIYDEVFRIINVDMENTEIIRIIAKPGENAQLNRSMAHSGKRENTGQE